MNRSFIPENYKFESNESKDSIQPRSHQKKNLRVGRPDSPLFAMTTTATHDGRGRSKRLDRRCLLARLLFVETAVWRAACWL